MCSHAIGYEHLWCFHDRRLVERKFNHNTFLRTNDRSHVIDRKRLRRGSRRPLNGVRHAETAAWQLHVVNVLNRFGGFWRWMTLNRSLPLWTAAVRKRFYFLFALVCENRKIAS